MLHILRMVCEASLCGTYIKGAVRGISVLRVFWLRCERYLCVACIDDGMRGLSVWSPYL